MEWLGWLISPVGAEGASLAMPGWLELSGVVVGAFAGILVARGRQLDPIGYVGLAILCGLGGGLIRDMILQAGSVYMIDDPYALPIATIMGLLVFFFPKTFMRAPRFVGWWDIFAVGLYTVAGADKTMVLGKLPFVIILMGVITGVGGGMLRDVFLGEVPRIFKKGNLYASCAIAGAVAYYLLVTAIYMRKPIAAFIAISITMAIRWWSVRYNYIMVTDDVELNFGARFKPLQETIRARFFKKGRISQHLARRTPAIPDKPLADVRPVEPEIHEEATAGLMQEALDVSRAMTLDIDPTAAEMVEQEIAEVEEETEA